eukprot:m.129941 g.129941  ORF g.129941 m.129941 type:complete len:363 (+) comp15864_c0_seq1:135-1223(+)
MTALRLLSTCRYGCSTRSLLQPLNHLPTVFHTSTSRDQKDQASLVLEPLVTPDSQSWQTPSAIPLAKLPNAYARLTKFRLSALVILTEMGGFALAPGAFDWMNFGVTAVGTGLCVAAANTYNQWIEIPYDAQMKRTRNRPLVSGELSPFHAWSFGTLCGLSGVGILAAGVNPLVAALGAGNILLYAGVYTPMKRMSIYNTWAGSLVGAIPPLMGWAAVTNSLDAPAFVLAGILFAWQFPHFNALSWSLRPDYSRAGYRMMSVTDPGFCRRVALQYTTALVPICLSAPALGLTSWYFALDSSLINGYILYQAYQFFKQGTDPSARKLFMTSLWHLPALMMLLLVHKTDPTASASLLELAQHVS